MVALQLAVVIVVGGPLLALTQPFVPILYQASIVFVAVCLLAFAFWRRASDLEEHVRAGAQVVVEVLARQGRTEELSLDDVQSLLPGLGAMTPVRLAPGSPAVGKTLAALDLRARTGRLGDRDHARPGEPRGALRTRGAARRGRAAALAGSREAIRPRARSSPANSCLHRAQEASQRLPVPAQHRRVGRIGEAHGRVLVGVEQEVVEELVLVAVDAQLVAVERRQMSYGGSPPSVCPPRGGSTSPERR